MAHAETAIEMKYLRMSFILLLFFVSGCATSGGGSIGGSSSPSRSPSSSSSETDAHYAVSFADGFWPDKKRPLRPMNHDMDFFFKHCTGSMSRTYYSKTSYGCETP